MDPLSDIVSRLKISRQKVVVFDIRNNTKVLFPDYTGVKIYIAKNCGFFLRIECDSVVYHLDEGDVVIMSSGRPFEIFDDLESTSSDIQLIHGVNDGNSYFSNGGCDFSFLGCRFEFKINDTLRFVTTLPEPMIINTKKEENVGIKSFLNNLSSEIENPGLGSSLITEHLLQIIMTKALRTILLSEPLAGGEGWFYAMADKNIGRALACIHDQPGKKWRLDELAKVAGMSRSAFTKKFRKLSGYSVIEYIRVWRFGLAVERMIMNNEKISQIAFDLGYESESAFSTAFKRSMGESPKNYMEKYNYNS